MTEFTKHLPHYLVLLGIFSLGFFGFVHFPYDKVLQTAITIAVCVSFVVWGTLHHHIHDDLHPKIVLEYVGTAVLGAVILLSLIWSA